MLFGDDYRLRRSAGVCTAMRDEALCGYTEADIAAGHGLWFEGSLVGETARTYIATLGRLAAQHPGTVYVFDQLDLWLVGGRGSHLVPGTLATGYLDTDHLSTWGSMYLWPYVCAAFDEWGFFDVEAGESVKK